MRLHRSTLLGGFALAAIVWAAPKAAHAQVFATPHSWTSTLTTNSPSFGGIASQNGPGVYYYDALSLIPDTTGSYVFTATAANLPNSANDTFYLLYSGFFDPISPTTGLITWNDDFNGLRSQITQNLTAGDTYTLVATTFTQDDTGTIDNQISGPGGSNIQLTSGASAPEPGSLALLGLGGALGIYKRRRKLG